MAIAALPAPSSFLGCLALRRFCFPVNSTGFSNHSAKKHIKSSTVLITLSQQLAYEIDRCADLARMTTHLARESGHKYSQNSHKGREYEISRMVSRRRLFVMSTLATLAGTDLPLHARFSNS